MTVTRGGLQPRRTQPAGRPGLTTVLNAKQVVDECMTGIALRKLGLGNRDYLSPLTRRDARR